MELDSLLAAYASGCDELRASIAGLSNERCDAVPVPGKWSVRQVLCHLTDFEIVNSERMQRVLAEDNPTLFDAAPDLFARRLAYAHRDILEEIFTIEYLRRRMLRILRCCDLEDFQRTGVHSTDGPVTLEGLLERTTVHVTHHIQFIQAKVDALRT